MHLYFILILLGLSSVTNAAVVHAESRVGKLSHFEFPEVQGWEYQIQRQDPLRLKLTLKKNELDLTSLKGFHSDFIKQVTVDEGNASAHQETVVTFELAKKNIEHFDYLTDQPNRLILDFYPDAAHPVEKEKTAAIPKKQAGQGKAAQKRAIASEGIESVNLGFDGSETSGAKPSGLFDGSDPGFERFSIKSYQIKPDAMKNCAREDFLVFPMLILEKTELQKLKANVPDFSVTVDEGEESKHAQLLKVLFERGRREVFLKTYGWFQEKFPQSKDKRVLAYMRLEILFQNWFESQKLDDLSLAGFQARQNIRDFGTDGLGERALAMTGYSQLQRGDALGAIKTFQEFLTDFTQSPLRDKVRLAVADALADLKHDADAEADYTQIAKDAHGVDQARAAFSLGDLSYRQKKYEEAIRRYDDALKKFAPFRGEFPNAIFNQAMGYFELKDYVKSLEKSRDFLATFSSSESAGFAMTRAGEALHCLGADPAKVVGAYLETSFRYGDTPAALVARLRLLQLRMKQMQALELDRAISEISEVQKKSDLPRIKEFTTLLLAEGFRERNEYDRALILLKKFIQSDPNSTYGPKMKQQITSVLAKNLENLVAKKNYLGALKLDQENEPTWLKNNARLDVDANLGLAYELAGDPEEAEKKYGALLPRLLSLSPEAKEDLQRAKSLPDLNRFYLRLAVVQAEQNKFQAAYDSMRAMKDMGALSDEEQIERVQLAAKLLHEKGEDLASAQYLKDLLAHEKDIGKSLVYASELSDAYLHLHRDDDALHILEGHFNDEVSKASDVVKKEHVHILEAAATIYEKNGKRDQAIQTYGRVLREDDQRAGVRYKLGSLELQAGQTAKAAETWKPLIDKGSLWGKLAKEQLASIQFQDNYKKYAERIPAMSEAKKTETDETGGDTK